MRVLLAALNAKYVHTNLALRYVRAGIRAEFPDVILKEFTINDSPARIAGEIYEAKADVIGFSCYIWNLSETLAVIRLLRLVCPETRMVVGGPEVSFEPAEFLSCHPEIDAVVRGEGERAFLELVRSWNKGQEPEKVLGVAWRREGKIIVNQEHAQLHDLNQLPFPYDEEEDLQGRLVYVETTRGCPFNCQYCLSSTIAGVRYLDPERFRLLLRRILGYGARTVKLVDRTFNVHKEHSMRILDIVREESKPYPDRGIRVHCEIAGELLDEEWLAYLRSYPEGLLQFEIGVQSTHEPTLAAISRPQHFERWRHYVDEIREFGTIPLHLDLIAGLPAEDWHSFRTSFNDVYAVQPDMLQLGFLKVLRGSGLRTAAKRYGLIYAPDPPYTILQTKVLSHAEILQLRRMEDLVDKYYNSGRFFYTLQEFVPFFPTPFDFYNRFANYWREQKWFELSWKGKDLFAKAWEFALALRDETSELRIEAARERVRDALRFDYYLWERPHVLPEFLKPTVPGSKAGVEDSIRFDHRWAELIPEFKTMDKRRWSRTTAIAYFSRDIAGDSQGMGAQSVEAEKDKDAQAERGVWYLFFYQGRPKAYRYPGTGED